MGMEQNAEEGGNGPQGEQAKENRRAKEERMSRQCLVTLQGWPGGASHGLSVEAPAEVNTIDGKKGTWTVTGTR